MYRKEVPSNLGRIDLFDVDHIRGYYSSSPITDEIFKNIVYVDRNAKYSEETITISTLTKINEYLREEYVGKRIYIAELNKIAIITSTRYVNTQMINSSKVTSDYFNTIDEFNMAITDEDKYYYITELDSVISYIRKMSDYNYTTTVKLDENVLSDKELELAYNQSTVLIKHNSDNLYSLYMVGNSSTIVQKKYKANIYTSIDNINSLKQYDLLKTTDGEYYSNKECLYQYIDSKLLVVNDTLTWGLDGAYNYTLKLNDNIFNFYKNLEFINDFGNSLISNDSSIIYLTAEEAQLDYKVYKFYRSNGESIGDSTNLELFDFSSISSYPKDIYINSDKYYASTLFTGDTGSILIKRINHVNNPSEDYIGYLDPSNSKVKSSNIKLFYIVKVDDISEIQLTSKNLIIYDGKVNKLVSSLETPRIEYPINTLVNEASFSKTIDITIDNIETTLNYSINDNLYHSEDMSLAISGTKNIVYTLSRTGLTTQSFLTEPDNITINLKNISLYLSKNPNIFELFRNSYKIKYKNTIFVSNGAGGYFSGSDTISVGTDKKLYLNGSTDVTDEILYPQITPIVVSIDICNKLFNSDKFTQNMYAYAYYPVHIIEPIDILDTDNLPDINPLIVKDSIGNINKSVTLTQVDDKPIPTKYFNDTNSLELSLGLYIYRNSIGEFETVDISELGSGSLLTFSGESDNYIITEINDFRTLSNEETNTYFPISPSLLGISVGDVFSPMEDNLEYYKCGNKYITKIVDGTVVPSIDSFSLAFDSVTGNRFVVVDYDIISYNKDDFPVSPQEEAAGVDRVYKALSNLLPIGAIFIYNTSTSKYEYTNSDNQKFAISIVAENVTRTDESTPYNLSVINSGICAFTITYTNGSQVSIGLTAGSDVPNYNSSKFVLYPLDSQEPNYDEFTFNHTYYRNSWNINYINNNVIQFSYQYPTGVYYKINNNIYYYKNIVRDPSIDLLVDDISIVANKDAAQSLGNYAYLDSSDNLYHIFRFEKLYKVEPYVYYLASQSTYPNITTLISAATEDLSDGFDNKAYKVARDSINFSYYLVSITYSYNYEIISINSTNKTYKIDSQSDDKCYVYNFQYDDDNLFNSYASIVLFGPDHSDGSENPLTYINLNNILVLNKGNKNSFDITFTTDYAYSFDETDNQYTYKTASYPSTVENSSNNYNIVFAVPKNTYKLYIKSSNFKHLHRLDWFDLDGNLRGDDSLGVSLTYNSDTGIYTLDYPKYNIYATSDTNLLTFYYGPDLVSILVDKYDYYDFYTYGRVKLTKVNTTINGAPINYIGNANIDRAGYYCCLDFYEINNCNSIYKLTQGDGELNITNIFAIRVNSTMDIPQTYSIVTLTSANTKNIKYSVDNDIPEVVFKLYTEDTYDGIKYEISNTSEEYKNHNMDIISNNIHKSLKDITYNMSEAKTAINTILLGISSDSSIGPDTVSKIGLINKPYLYVGYNEKSKKSFLYCIDPIETEDDIVLIWNLLISYDEDTNVEKYRIAGLPFYLSELDKLQKPIIYFVDNNTIGINLNNTINLINLSTMQITPKFGDRNVLIKYSEYSDITGYSYGFDGVNCYLFDSNMDEIDTSKILDSSYPPKLYLEYKYFTRMLINNNYDFNDIYLFDSFLARNSQYNTYIYPYSPFNNFGRYSMTKVDRIESKFRGLVYLSNSRWYDMNFKDYSNSSFITEVINKEYITYRNKQYKIK